MAEIRIKSPGMLTTIQDKGIFGQQGSGISPAGAMDIDSLRYANILVDNDEFEAALEITIMGPVIAFSGPAVIAICGADLSPKLDGKEIANNKAIAIKDGQILSFGARKNGCRAYVAFAGGLDTPLLFNSRSTLLRNKLGGIDGKGRALKAGDEIKLRREICELENMDRRYVKRTLYPEDELTVRITLGPQDDCFTEKGLNTLLDPNGFVMTDRCNRQGYRLEGKEKIEHIGNGNIVSDGIATGAIQVPPDGTPIIMMVERQSTGGYPKAACVISADFPGLGQALPGTRLKFEKIEIEEAQKILAEKERDFKNLKQKIRLGAVRIFSMETQGKRYRVTITPWDKED